ncbi:hypothetical protein GEMRC1_002972 [Eukaryota sp. GEM-RC1]
MWKQEDASPQRYNRISPQHKRVVEMRNAELTLKTVMDAELTLKIVRNPGLTLKIDVRASCYCRHTDICPYLFRDVSKSHIIWHHATIVYQPPSKGSVVSEATVHCHHCVHQFVTGTNRLKQYFVPETT